MTYRWFIDETEHQLSHLYNGEEGRAIAARLLQHYCGIAPYEHLIEPYAEVAERYLSLLQNALQQLAAARPLQYVIGYQEFLGRNFFVSEGVLIPRSETEELVLWALEYINDRCITIIDAACGSGAIAVSIAASLPQSKVYAFDISERALEIAQKNNETLLPYSSRVTLFRNDLFHYQNIGELSEQADIIISNPPYVTNAEKESMRRNVLDFEPEEALFVPDDDPLIFYKALERFSSQHLKPGGAIFLEVNEQFGAETAAIFKKAGYTNVVVRQDIFGKDRMVMAVKYL